MFGSGPDVLVLNPAGCSEAELLALVASVEEHASHPVTKSVVEAARERDLQHITHGEVDYLVAHRLAADVTGPAGSRRVRINRTNCNLAVGINIAILGGALMGWLSLVAGAVLPNSSTSGISLHALAGVSQAPGVRGQAAERLRHL